MTEPRSFEPKVVLLPDEMMDALVSARARFEDEAREIYEAAVASAAVLIERGLQ